MTRNAWGRFKAMCPSIHPSCYFIYRTVWACSRGGLCCRKPNQKRPIMLCVLWHAPILDDVFSDIPLKNGPKLTIWILLPGKRSSLQKTKLICSNTTCPLPHPQDVTWKNLIKIISWNYLSTEQHHWLKPTHIVNVSPNGRGRAVLSGERKESRVWS